MLRSLGAMGAAGATNAAIAALTLVNGVIVARLLGPEGRGALFALLAYPTVVAGTLGAFVQPALARRAALRPDASPRELNGLCLWSAAPLALASGLLAAAILLGAPGLTGAERAAGLVYAAGWTPANFLLMNLLALDLGRARWRRYNTLRFLLYPLILGCLLLTVVFGRTGVRDIVGVYLASNLALLGVRLGIAWREGGFGRPSRAGLAAFFREAAPFFAPGATTALSGQLDELVAAGALGHEARGLYAVAQRAGGLTAPLGAAAGQVAFADAAARQTHGSPEQARRELAPLRLTAAALGVLAVCLAPAVWFLIPRLYGNAFAGARTPALFCLGGSALLALAQAGEQRLEGAGRPGLALRSRAAGVVALLALAVPAALVFGLHGLVAGVASAQALRSLLLCRTLAAFHQVPFAAVVLAGREDLRQARRLAFARAGDAA